VIRYREIAPPPCLQAFLSTFWILEHDADGATPQRIVPDGHCELIPNWSEPFEAFQNGQWRRRPGCF
jgi:hypothetical protein